VTVVATASHQQRQRPAENLEKTIESLSEAETNFVALEIA